MWKVEKSTTLSATSGGADQTMASPFHHALSSVKKWGGAVEDYLKFHNWFDASKEHHGDFRHRALRHHSEGIFELERLFGFTFVNSSGREVPTRWVGEQHVIEDCGFIPTLSDWLSKIRPEPWMNKASRLERDVMGPKVYPSPLVGDGEAI